MIRRLTTGIKFAAKLMREFFERWAQKGVRPAYILLRVEVVNFLRRQRNKSGRYDDVECPCCGWKGYSFLDQDNTTYWLEDVYCPECRSHERQRLLYLYIRRHDPEIFEMEGRVLHFAAEADMREFIMQNKKLRYFSTEYDARAAKLQCLPGTGFRSDVQQLGVKSDSFDLLFCLHVLEHVQHDVQAIHELNRVLRPGGIAYIMVPFDMALEKTIGYDAPDPNCWDHWWAYSRFDFKEKLDCFDYEEVKNETFLTKEEIDRYKIPDKEIIYRCVKRGDG